MTTQTQSSILEFYHKRKPDFSWQDIADILNTNKGTAWEIAHGKRAPTQDQELRWMFWLTFGPSANHRTIPAIPCPTCGQLHQVDDCHGAIGEPAIVPAGARVVQSKPAQPKRERTQSDVTRLRRAGWSVDEINRVHAAMRDYPDDMRNLMRLLSVIPGEPDPNRLIDLVDDWLAEDAGTDPAEVAAVLARLE